MHLYNFMKNTVKEEESRKRMLEDRNEEIQLQNELIKETNLKLEEAKAIVEARNKNLDKMVKKRTKELLTANEDLATFLYRSSHDIQGPIASIKGIYNLANYDSNASSDYLSHINKSIIQLDTRVKSINAVFEVKQRKVEKTPIDLKSLITKVLDENNDYISNNNFTVRFEMDTHFEFRSDKVLLDILFQELSKNAFQFKSEDKLELDIVAKTLNKKMAKISFSDNGQGIPVEIRAEIFDMFKRGNAKSQGSGLGLYAANLAVSKLDGKIEVFSDGMTGTTFEITLPIY